MVVLFATLGIVFAQLLPPLFGDEIDKFGVTDVTQWGAVCDGETNDTQAFLDAAASDAAVVRIPVGTCRLLAPIDITTPGQIWEGSGRLRTVLDWPNETDGFHIQADLVRIRQMEINGGGRCITTGWNPNGTCKSNRHAVSVQNTGFEISDVRIGEWSGIGIKGHCSESTGYNCNNTRVINVTIDRVSGAAAIRPEGSDANVWYIESPSLKTNDGWGVQSLAFIGPTTIVGGAFNTNADGAITATKSGDRSTIIGTYLEDSTVQGHDKIRLGGAAVMIGGHVDTTNVSGGGAWMAQGIASGKWTFKNDSDATNVVSTILGSGFPRTSFRTETTANSQPIALTYEPTKSAWEIRRASLGSQTGLQISVGTAQVLPGLAAFPLGLYIGSGAAARKIDSVQGEPTSACSATNEGDWARDRTAQVDNYALWICAQDYAGNFAWHGAVAVSP